MWYLTTRTEQESVTPLTALEQTLSTDGGRFLPVVFPQFSPERLQSLGDKAFCRIVAEVLNEFFSACLGERDVEFCLGREPMVLWTVSRRTLAAEAWHNPEGSISRMEDNLTRRMGRTGETPSEWARIAVRISLLFGLYGMLMQREPGAEFDLAVSGETLYTPLAACYARSMGLPIRTIVVGCADDRGLWELLRRGELRAGSIRPDGCLERLIYDCLGRGEAAAFARCAQTGQRYAPAPEQMMLLGQTMHPWVVSEKRVQGLSGAVRHTAGRELGREGILAYGGLLNERAASGSVRTAVVFTGERPQTTE